MLAGNSIMKKFCPDNYGVVLSGLAHICSRRNSECLYSFSHPFQLSSLPEKQRMVFTLRYYDEMPYEEMSRVLDTSEGALKASYHHAVKKVEDFLLNH